MLWLMCFCRREVDAVRVDECIHISVHFPHLLQSDTLPSKEETDLLFISIWGFVLHNIQKNYWILFSHSLFLKLEAAEQ